MPITVETWPRSPVPQLPVWRAPASLDDRGWIVYEGEDGELSDSTMLPAELVLRGLFGLDIGDDAAVVDFVDTYGWINATYPADELARLFPPLERPNEIPIPVGATNHVADAVAYLKTARAMARHWIAEVHETDVREAWGCEGIPVGSEADAWAHFTNWLSRGLRPYTPRVVVRMSEIPSFEIGIPHLGLYEGLCLQLFNLRVERLRPERCANETCNNYFVRQSGGAEHGQYRKHGVKYCSVSCARAQAQRRYRRTRPGSSS